MHNDYNEIATDQELKQVIFKFTHYKEFIVQQSLNFFCLWLSICLLQDGRSNHRHVQFLSYCLSKQRINKTNNNIIIHIIEPSKKCLIHFQRSKKSLLVWSRAKGFFLHFLNWHLFLFCFRISLKLKCCSTRTICNYTIPTRNQNSLKPLSPYKSPCRKIWAVLTVEITPNFNRKKLIVVCLKFKIWLYYMKVQLWFFNHT